MVMAPLAALKRGLPKELDPQHRVLDAPLPPDERHRQDRGDPEGAQDHRVGPAVHRRLDDPVDQRDQPGDRQHRPDRVQRRGFGV
jgi:hypothetical protein